MTDIDIAAIRQRIEQGDRAGAEALAVGIAGAALQADDFAAVIAVTRILSALAAPWGGGVEALREAIKNRLPDLVGTPGGDREQKIALCDAVIELAPALDAPWVEWSIISAIYLIDDLDRSRPYTERLFALGRRLEERVPAEGPPECSLADCSLADGAERARHILAGHGVVLVRGLASVARCEATLLEFERVAARDGVSAVPLDTLDLGFSLFRAKSAAILQALLASVLGTPVLQPQISVARRVDSRVRATATPFHQDTRAFGYNLVNVWTPLVACGETLPGLEFVARRVFEPLRTERSDDEYDHVKIDRDLVVRRFGEAALFAPAMAVGDVLVFLGSTIHRTHLTPAMNGPRSSMEMRYTSPW